MGKKAKVGKKRKDKFYHLAKETGYRARSAFKLIQLNRKFSFLQESRVLLDLCAAPGGWLQVASKFMPMSSVILGVDLVSIKPIKNVTTFQSDITTEQCRQYIRKELKQWKVDVVLNDGAPNVGSAWVQDAFSQAQLALSALKLASEFLRKGGWFITKVFRSKDYAALMWVFQQLFKKVHSTKPQASRNESAEIFVVCQGYLAPDKLDEKFLDSKHVFKEVQQESKVRLNILHPEKVQRHREGYSEGNMGMHTTIKASDFINSSDAIELLSTANQIEIDDEKLKTHELTTKEVVECCQDIKVLGKRELKTLLQWRKKLCKSLKMEKEDTIDEKEVKEEDEKEETEEDVDNMIAEMKEAEDKEAKKKRKKVREEKKKIREKLASKMSAAIESSAEMDLFSLNTIKNKEELTAVEENATNFDLPVEEDETDDDEEEDEDEEEEGYVDDGDEYIYADDSLYEKQNKTKGEDYDEQTLKEKKKKKGKKTKESTENPLLVDLDEEDKKKDDKVSKAAVWFQKDIFKNIENEDDEEYDIEQMMGKAGKEEKGKKQNKKVQFEAGTKDEDDDDMDDDEESEEDSDSDDSDVDDRSIVQGKTDIKNPNQGVKVKGNSFEIAPQTPQEYLNPEALALGTAMVTSRKRKRDIIDDAYNRYSFGEENLPSWFAEDELKHRKRNLPITREEVEFYKQRLREINARPIKKVIEAKAKKKSKELKKLDRARKKAEGILDAADVTDKEKQSQIKGIYKRAGLLKKKRPEVKYVVAKKAQSGKRYARPSGLKGQYKVVDPRMKKDLKAAKSKEKTKGRKKVKKR